MAYDTSKLQTIAECDRATAIASQRKAELLFEQTVHNKQLTDQAASTALMSASLIGVIAQITGTEASIAAMPEGKQKDNEISRLRRLNDRRENLEDSLKRGGSAALLDAELEAGLLVAQIAEIDAYLTAIATRRDALDR